MKKTIKKYFPTVFFILLVFVGFNAFGADRPESVPVAQGGKTDSGTVKADQKKLPSSMNPSDVRRFLSKKTRPSTARENNYIILNFDNAELKDVINTISSITKENFILPQGISARITIHSARKIPVDEVMNVFESVLEANNMSLVRSGQYYKVVQSTATKQKPLEVFSNREAGSVSDVDRPVTQIVNVMYVPVTEVSAVLTPMLTPAGSIIPNPRNNLLIINDLSSNLIRMLRVLAEIDVNAFENTRMIFFKPKYSDVLSLSNELTEVLNALNLTREGIAVVPIERINSVIIFSSSATLLSTVEGWMKKLDEEVMTGQNIFVYPVQNVKAESVSEILKALYETGDIKAVKPGVVARTAQTGAKRTIQRKVTPQKARSAQQQAGSRVEIITFEPTNSLVILAPPGIYREIEKTIKTLDVYPREVLIEAIIAEVSVTETDKRGIQWSVLQDLSLDGKDFTTLTEQGLGPGVAPALVSAAPTLASGPSGGLSFVLFRPDKISALIHAIASKGKINILSSPRLLVRDQEEAKIEVGEEIPTATSTTSSTTTETLTQNIEYRTVGIKLKIKPTINSERTVVLDLEQEVSDKGENQQVGQTGNLFPSFTTTKAKTSIIVPDRQGIIIGGIIKEKLDTSFEGIPLLSSIPGLGVLFRHNEDEIRKRELIILIVPHVITEKSGGEKLTSELIGRLKELKTFILEKDSSAGFDLDHKEISPSRPNER